MPIDLFQFARLPIKLYETKSWTECGFQVFLAAEMVVYAAEITDPDPLVQTKIKSAIQKNYAKADVFFQTLNVVNIEQSPLLDVS